MKDAIELHCRKYNVISVFGSQLFHGAQCQDISGSAATILTFFYGRTGYLSTSF